MPAKIIRTDKQKIDLIVQEARKFLTEEPCLKDCQADSDHGALIARMNEFLIRIANLR